MTIAGMRPFGLGHEECETAIRERLGEAAFTTAFDRGADMPFDQAICFALDEPSSATVSGPSTGGGTVELTKRELEIAELISEGLTNRQIAAKLVISRRTAETHLRHILEKLGFGSRAQVAAWITGQSTQPETSGKPPAN